MSNSTNIENNLNITQPYNMSSQANTEQLDNSNLYQFSTSTQIPMASEGGKPEIEQIQVQP